MEGLRSLSLNTMGASFDLFLRELNLPAYFADHLRDIVRNGNFKRAMTFIAPGAQTCLNLPPHVLAVRRVLIPEIPIIRCDRNRGIVWRRVYFRANVDR